MTFIQGGFIACAVLLAGCLAGLMAMKAYERRGRE